MSTPLQYESLKTIIQYLDPNLRFQLAQRIPSLRSVEKIVPLKLHNLSLSSTSMTINDTTYQLGVCRDYSDETMPHDHWEINERGGLDHDLDQWGFNDYTGRNVKTPGDLFVDHGLVPIQYERNFDNEQRNYERKLRVYQQELARRLERGVKLPVAPISGTREAYLSAVIHRTLGFERFSDFTPMTPLDVKPCEVSIGALQFHITRLQASLAPYYCRRDGVPLKWTPRIQLTVKKGEVKQFCKQGIKGQEKQIYHYAYTMKLHEAMKSLSSRFFGDRRQMINVRTFDAIDIDKVIRLPVGMKVKIQNLKVGSKFLESYQMLEPIIDKVTLPLDTLHIKDGFERLRDCEIEAFRTAKSLVLHESDPDLDEFMVVIRQLRNMNVHVECDDFPVQEQVDFIQHWVRSERLVGARFSYEVYYLKDVKKLEQEIRRLKEAGELEQNAFAKLNNRHAELRFERIERTDEEREKYIVILEDKEIPRN